MQCCQIPPEVSGESDVMRLLFLSPNYGESYLPPIVGRFPLRSRGWPCWAVPLVWCSAGFHPLFLFSLFVWLFIVLLGLRFCCSSQGFSGFHPWHWSSYLFIFYHLLAYMLTVCPYLPYLTILPHFDSWCRRSISNNLRVVYKFLISFYKC
jgi:hypothetical protein